MWDVEVNTVVFQTISTMIFFIFTYNIVKYYSAEDRYLQIRDSTKKHSWKMISGTSKVYYLDSTPKNCNFSAKRF